jgi:hypothetical protein
MGFDLVPRSPLNSVQIPANANGGRSSLSANHTTSFFLVSGFAEIRYETTVSMASGKSPFFANLTDGWSLDGVKLLNITAMLIASALELQMS